MNPVFEGANYANITSTTTVRTAATDEVIKLIGIFVASASATPTIKVEDGAGTTVVNTFTPVAGVFYPMPCNLQTSLIVTISGTVDCTVFWG